MLDLKVKLGRSLGIKVRRRVGLKHRRNKETYSQKGSWQRRPLKVTTACNDG